jgi:hypothetical protein
MFFEGDDNSDASGCYFNESASGHYESIEREEEFSTARALSQTYSALFEPKITEKEAQKDIGAVIDDDENNDEFHAYFRGPSVGYSAHCDTVDEIELDSWRSAFPYLHVQGSQVKGEKNEDENILNPSQSSENCYSNNDFSSSADFNMCIVGKKMQIFNAENMI